VTTYATTRTVRFDATRIAAVVALLLSALALGVALSNRHTTAADSSRSRATTAATTTVAAPTTGNLTRQQAIAHAMRVDAAGSTYASSNVTSTRTTATTTPVNRYVSKLKIMDAHATS
jgi:hypothetical protein